MHVSNHARERMRQRGITMTDVNSALTRRLDPPLPGSGPNTVAISGYTPGGRILKLVLSSDERVRVTAWWET